MADTDESVVGFEFLHGLDRVVDQSEASGLATTVLSPHAENVDLILVGLVNFGQFRAEVVLGDVWSVGVEDITIDNMLEDIAREHLCGVRENCELSKRRSAIGLSRTRPSACARGVCW